jgi:peroxidase
VHWRSPMSTSSSHGPTLSCAGTPGMAWAILQLARPNKQNKKKTKSASPTTPSRPPAAVQRPYLTVPYLPPATPSSPVDRLRSLPCRLGAVAAPSRALPLTSSSLRQLLPSYYALSCRSVELAMRDVAKQLRYASTVDPIIPGRLLDIVRQIRNGIVPLAIFW